MATVPPAPFGSKWGGNETAKRQVKNRFQWSDKRGAPQLREGAVAPRMAESRPEK